MNVWGHLGEIRQRLIRSMVVLFVLTGCGAYFVNDAITWLAKPVHKLYFLKPTEVFSAQLKVAIGIGFVLGLPYFLYQFWSFVSEGLKSSERTYFRAVIPVSYLLFMGGMSFAAFLVFPKAVAFLMTFSFEALTPMLSVDSYLSFFTLLALAFGFLFQLPLVLHFFARLGLLRPQFLEGNRRISYFLIFVFATLFNPVPEVFTQLLLAGVAITLFEASIVLVKFEAKRRPPRA